MKEFCSSCGRRRPMQIADPSCPDGGYCKWIESVQPMPLPPPTDAIAELSALLRDADLRPYFHQNGCPMGTDANGRPSCRCWALYWPNLKDNPSSPDDLRRLGWMVAVHNDYVLDGKRYTFWLMTKDERCLKGEGSCDAVALDQIRAKLRPEEMRRKVDRAWGIPT